MNLRIGHSTDVHQLVPGRPLILGGVEIPHEKGLLGHSDADCLLHVVTEAILGALALGDIGTHFPDTDPKYKDVDSKLLLKEAVNMAFERGYKVNNIDCTIYAGKNGNISPKCKIFAQLLQTDITNVNVKATRGEKMVIGREGIASEAVVLLIKVDSSMEHPVKVFHFLLG